jgi:hypothetical protein
MTGDTKGDILNRAFSALRISGITAVPSPEDLELGLMKLENMAAEFQARNVCTGYYFEDDPDPNTPHNMERKFWHSYDVLLAVRLMPDYGKGEIPDVALIRQATSAYSFLSSSTAKVKQVPYPDRMPTGSDNRWERFFVAQVEAPSSGLTNTMYVDDRRTFVEHFDSILVTGETIASFTISANTGLTINSSSLATPDVTYNITAVGSPDGSASPYLSVKIIATTSTGRIETRIINFKVISNDIGD